MLSKLRTQMRALLRRSRVERELDEELRYHIEQQTDQNRRLGMIPEEARQAALKSFGGMEQAKERSRDARGLRRLEEIWQDLLYGARTLLRRPVFTLAVILTLALGVGANTAIFSVFNGVVLKPPPYKDPDRLVNVRRSDKRGMRYQPGVESNFGNASPGGFHDWRERSRSFESMTAYRQNSTILSDADRTMYVAGLRVASRFFETHGVNAQLGRTFTDRDYSPDAPRVVIFANDLWRNHYGAEPQTTISSLPGSKEFESRIKLYNQIEERLNALPGVESAAVSARLPIAVAAREEMGRIDRDIPLRLVRTMEGVIADTLWRERLSAWLLGLFAALAVTLAAAGLYGVMSYAVSQRTQELGLRIALGAETGVVMRMVLGEGFKLTFVGLALGLIAAFALSRFISSQLFGVTGTDPLTYAGVALLLALVALIACYLPARRAAKVDPLVALRCD